jgi:hypothetical protein
MRMSKEDAQNVSRIVDELTLFDDDLMSMVLMWKIFTIRNLPIV